MKRLTEQEITERICADEQALLDHLERSQAPRIPKAIMTRPGLAAKLIEFADVYRLYRERHGRRYSARIAYGIAFRGLPF